VKPRQNSGRTARPAALAILLLALGLVTDLGFTRPRLQEVRRLMAERTRVLETLARVSQTEREALDLAHRLGAGDLSEALAAQRREDPLTYLGQEVERAHLVRRELGSQASETVGSLRRNRYHLGVRGSYFQILGFLRTIEQGSWLVTVDALSMEQMPESADLEGRIYLSVYGIPGGEQP
jgi:hypothetical protein